MNEFEEGIDPALRAEFLDDSLDSMKEVADLFVELEADPDNGNTVQAIFRPVHSIKGNAVYFGLMQTKTLAHEMETILDLMRKGALSPTGTVTDLLLRGSDELMAMLRRARAGEAETPDAEGFDRLVEGVKALAAGGKADEEGLWNGLLTVIAERAGSEALALAHQLAQFSAAGRKALGVKEADAEAVAGEPEPARRLRECLEAEDAEPDEEDVRALLAECKALAATPESQSRVDTALSEVDVLVGSIGLGDPVSRKSQLAHLDAMAQAGAWEADGTSANTPQTAAVKKNEGPSETPGTANPQTEGGGKTMRIPEESIDKFLAFVGELVTIGEMYGHLHGNLAAGGGGRKTAAELRRINKAFGDLSLSLQHSIMHMRKVPLNNILSRAPRIVRDIATAKGKDIETRVRGGGLLADKSLVDTLEAPLTHMVRNAADHGVEAPADREAAGKPAKGVIEIAAEETGDEIILTVRDDGAGLNREALAAKAAELGMIAPDATLTDEGIMDLLFKSGVSTASEVTDVSGRGVGMDVAKHAIEEMGGHVAVSSESGRGAEFTVRLPKTVSTQIIDGFIVLADGNRHVFPLERIVRCFRPTPGDVVSVQGKGLCVKDGKRLLRVRSLAECFGRRTGTAPDMLRDGILVVVETKSQPIAVHVDAIEGVRQIVLKNIEGLLERNQLFAGGAIMGDGAVAMVLDTDRIADETQTVRSEEPPCAF